MYLRTRIIGRWSGVICLLLSMESHAQTVTIKLPDNKDNYYFPSRVSPVNRLAFVSATVPVSLPDSNGIVQIKAAGQPFYTFSGTTFYIEPGQTLEVNLADVRYAKDIRFKGPQAAANKWMHQHLLSKYTPLIAEQVPEPGMSYAAYRQMVKENAAMVRAGLDTVTAGPAFKETESRMVSLLTVISLLRYYELKLAGNYSQQGTVGSLYNGPLHDSVLADIKSTFPVYNDAFNDRPEAVRALAGINWFDSTYFSTLKVPGYADLQKVMQVTGDENMFYHADFKALEKQLTNGSLKKLVRSWQEQYGPLQPGRPAIDWAMQDEQGHTIRLSSLKGKPLYIDIWATWCNPCVALKPVFEKLADSCAAGSPVQFVAISVDRNAAQWKRFLEQHAGRSPHVKQYLITDPRFLKSYQVPAIPRFMLFDEQFRIVDSKAPNPGDTDGIQRAFDQWPQSVAVTRR